MGLFRKLFGKKETPPPPSSADSSAAASAPPAASSSVAPSAPAAEKGRASEDPNLIKVLDEFGRELLISRQQWLDNVLLGNLEKHREDPDALYGLLAGALKDGFAAEVLPYAEHLSRIDPVAWRGPSILASVYLQSQRLDEAEQVLEEYLDLHGEEGAILTNLAKVYSQRGEEARAEELLWRALELDPNQDNALLWLASIHCERGGEVAQWELFREVAELPGSWRAHLWLARQALQDNDLAGAQAEYRTALENGGDPVPPDLLMQLSGDLGNAGHLEEIVRLAGAYYDPVIHGIEAANNFLKANLELGRLKETRRLLQRLYALDRPDWNNTLAFWESELAKAEVASKPDRQPEEPAITVLSIEGPIWMRHGSPCSALVPAKGVAAPRFMIFGSTVIGEKTEQAGRQLSDPPGRLSRSLPLLMAEAIQIASEAVGVALIPWVQGEGFALFSRPYEDDALCMISGSGDDAPDYLIGVTLDTGSSGWQVLTRLIRRVDGERLAETSIALDPENPGPAIYKMCAGLSRLLTAHTGVSMTSAPSWYQLPAGNYVADYLLRLEQQLTVSCQTLDYLEGGDLYGEREILDGVLRLCADQPENPTVWMLYAQTLRLMKKVRPELVEPHREKIARLWREHPVNREVEPFLVKALEEVFAG
ncbi:MAG TPA: tetratricopeptide repeat protein [Geomonas sp.]|nr:tetratricopeptide repeat protein [Geomonas sp.]